jgi:hypothetical protein
MIEPLKWAQVEWYAYQFPWRTVHAVGNITAITATIWKAAILVLLIEEFYGMALRCTRSMIYVPSFMKIDAGVLAISGFVSEIWEVVMLVLLAGEIYELRSWDGIRWHDIRIFMNIDSGIETLLVVIHIQRNIESKVFLQAWFYFYKIRNAD